MKEDRKRRKGRERVTRRHQKRKRGKEDGPKKIRSV
jgi:hypothetical protein